MPANRLPLILFWPSARKPELAKVEMTRYFGVKCATFEEPIPLAQQETEQRRTIAFYVVPVTPVTWRYCGSSHLYASPDSFYFDGPDDLLSS